MIRLLFVFLLVFPSLALSKDDEKKKDVKKEDAQKYESEKEKNSKEIKQSSNNSPEAADYQNHLRSTNKINHYEYIKNRKKVRRSHIRHEVNRKDFVDANDIYPGGKVSSMAVEARNVDSHDDNIDRFTRECIRHIRENLGENFEFLEVSYLTKRSEDRRDPAAFSVDMVTGLCHAKPKSSK